jgi:hypothetical protein
MPKSHYNTVKNKKGKFVKLSNKQLLKNSHPKLLNEWDYQKNKKISLEGLSYKSVKSVHWKCKKNHSWTTSPYHRTIDKTGCPYCARPSSKPEIRIYCELIKFFPNVKSRFKFKNKEIDVFLPEQKLAIEYDGYYYHKNRIKEDQTKNNFYKKNKIELIRIREWTLPKTRDEDISGHKLGINKQNMNSIFRILKDKKILNQIQLNEYLNKKSFINNRLYTKIVSELPAPPYKDSLAFKNKELSKEFDLEKNFPFTPSYFRTGSHTKVHWVCSKNSQHKWVQTIKNRALLNSGCPNSKCRTSNYNKNIDLKKSLEFKSPTLTKEFDLKKNLPLTPSTIGVGYKIPVFWVCSKDNTHKWKATIGNRFHNKTTCPKCRYINAVGKKISWSMTKTRVLYNIKRTNDPAIKQKWINRLKEFN